MWYGLRVSRKAHPDLVPSAAELLQSTLRYLILTTSGIYLAWHFAATATWPGGLTGSTWFITAVVVLTYAIVLWLLRKWLLAAQAVWQMGLAVAITLSIYVFQQPKIAFFYALPPLMAVVTVGWPASLLAGGLMVALVWWLPRIPVMPPLPAAYSLEIILGGIHTGLLGRAAIHALLTATFESKRLYLETEVPADLPPVFCDSTRVR